MPRPKTYSVRELVGQLQRCLWDTWGTHWVVGEIGELKVAASGHWFGTLVEGPDALSITLMRQDAQRLRFSPKAGDKVAVQGRLEVYRGRLQLRARTIEPVGEGARARALEQLKAKLTAEGLFSPERKRPLPRVPAVVGVVTSRGSAAFQDFLTVLGRRMPRTTVVIASCRVQGDGAADEIARAIRRLDRHGRAEVVVVTRGGGSVEDLWAFNEEAVVRAVAACGVPVISAVGHEVDITLCDLVADVRVATPSAAAERVVPDRRELAGEVGQRQQRLAAALRAVVARDRRRVARQRLVHPGERVKLARQRLVRLQVRLTAAGPRRVEARRRDLGAAASRLEALSPLAVLGRGYAIALKDGVAVRAAGEVEVGDRLQLRLGEGALEVEVVEG